MVVRKTDLKNAVEDFRAMVGQSGYRSVSSMLARKQGYNVFGKERMTEFWAEMQIAYRATDEKFMIAAGEGTISKGLKRAERAKEEMEGPVIKRKKI